MTLKLSSWASGLHAAALALGGCVPAGAVDPGGTAAAPLAQPLPDGISRSAPTPGVEAVAAITGRGIAGFGIGGDQIFAQTFLADKSGAVTGIDLHIRASWRDWRPDPLSPATCSAIPSLIKVGLYGTDDTGRPVGPPLAMANGSHEAGFAWVTFALDRSVSLEAGKRYAIVVSGTGAELVAGGGAATPGATFWQKDGAGAWLSMNPPDVAPQYLLFKAHAAVEPGEAGLAPGWTREGETRTGTTTASYGLENLELAQTFVAGATGPVAGFQFLGRATGTREEARRRMGWHRLCPVRIEVRVHRTDAAGAPTGEPLATGSGIAIDRTEWFTLPLDRLLTVEAGVRYAIVLHAPSGSVAGGDVPATPQTEVWGKWADTPSWEAVRGSPPGSAALWYKILIPV